MQYQSVPRLFWEDGPHIQRLFCRRKGLVFTCAVVLLSLSGHVGQRVTGGAEPLGGHVRVYVCACTCVCVMYALYRNGLTQLPS